MKSKNFLKIIKTLKSKGFKNIELDPVIESKYILKRSGENIRKYLFSFNSNSQDFSLIPDLSISSILKYAQSTQNKKAKVFYTGSAFRKSYNKKNVVVRQIGMEIFSSLDENKDDKEIIDTSIKIVKNLGLKKATVELNNFKLFKLLIEKLPLALRWKARLIKFYWNKKYFLELLKRLESNSDIDPFQVEIDKKMFLKMKKENPKKIIAGRNYQEIIQRYLTKINDPRNSKTGRYSAKIIKEFLKIECSLKNAPKKLNNFYKKHNLNIFVEKGFFPVSNLKQKNINFKFSTNIGRGREITYYSSLIFLISAKEKNYISGGRYNDLASKTLGLKKISAVGAAVHT
tara:strand:+ start:326 stop:1357 length:1032 start_codon:yes stop_codon:yes gene_type:complete